MIMKKQFMTKEEQEILQDFDRGVLKRVKDVPGEKTRYGGYAKYTLSKPRNINIRISDRDLERIKALAAEKGLPYQTFISSILHQYPQ